MCLLIKTNNGKYPRAQRAKTDIVCYKLLFEHETGPLTSPYYSDTIWETGLIKKAPRFFRPLPKAKKPKGGSYSYYELRHGYLHSYGRVDVAENWLSLFQVGQAGMYASPNNGKYVVYKAIIPKGTVYYEGERNEYASRKLKLIEKL